MKEVVIMKDLLRQYWGYEEFRPLQQSIIESIINSKDTFVMLPTGAGKSICYQLPALMMRGVCIVISPLISLMQDQVANLKKRDIPAEAIFSGMSDKEVDNILNATLNEELKFLYLLPERIQSEKFKLYLPDIAISFFAVDEAHCISQWGHDFRPAYRRIHELKNDHPIASTIALTASATPKVQEDIIDQLQLNNPDIYKQSVTRPKLYYASQYSENKIVALSEAVVKENSSSIVYTRSRKRCTEVALSLSQQGIDAAIYHAGLKRKERELTQQRWMQSNDKVICATTAFGMGIDKADVRMVAHYDVPESMEEYYQEAGRAGRDGKNAIAIMYHNASDVSRLKNSVSINFPPVSYLKQLYKYVGDYLQIAVGSGFEAFFSFDIMDFISVYKLETLSAINAIKILSREGLWQWEEDVYTRSTVLFTTNKASLEYIENTEPELYKLTTALLRQYGSIYHFTTIIDEFLIAKILGKDKSNISYDLHRLQAMGILHYQPALRGGTIFWRHDRVPIEYLQLNIPLLNTLRKAHEERIQAMLEYVENKTLCRNILLARYFGDTLGQSCGNCDVCRKGNIKQLAKSNIDDLLKFIKIEKQLSIQKLINKFVDIDEQTVISWVRKLADEGLCRIYPTGIIFAV